MSCCWSVLSLVASLLACGPRTARIQAVEVGSRDAVAHLHGDPIELAVVGHAGHANADLFDDLRSRDLEFVVLAGDMVRRSTVSEWSVLQERSEGLAIVPVVGASERHGDRRLRAFTAAWQGLGVSDLSSSVPWFAFDLVNRSIRWRVVVLDGHRAPLGDRWMDQLFWVPKVVGDTGYDHLIVVVGDGPGHMDGLAAYSAGAEELLELVRRHADPSRFLLVLSGGADVPAVVLPGGRWGEAWVSTGRTTPPAAPLHRRIGPLQLETGFEDALIEVFEARSGRDLDGVRTSGVFPPASAPLLGWWSLHIDGSALGLTLQLAGDGGFSPAYDLTWGPGTGWEGGSTASPDPLPD